MERYMIRITEIPKEAMLEMLGRFSNDALIIVCAEGEPYDKDVRSHVHIYLECKHSESWIRKQIQKLDPNRKSNQLYSMKKAHEQSPNYVLKNYYNENENRSRIWFQQNCSLDLLLTWKQMHEKYMAEVNAAKVVRKKSKKTFSQLIIEEAVGKFQDSSPSTEEIIQYIVELYNKEELRLPTRSQMELYVLNVRNKIHHSRWVLGYYLKNFSQY